MTDQPKPETTPAPTQSKAEAIARIVEMKAELRRQAMTSGPSGAMPNAPTGVILDASAVQELNPDSRIRWVHAKKAQRRQVEGYVRVPEVEGGRTAGDLILMALPRAEYEARVNRIQKLNADRLDAHNKEMETAAESIAKHLRDNHGVNVKAEQILVKG